MLSLHPRDSVPWVGALAPWGFGQRDICVKMPQKPAFCQERLQISWSLETEVHSGSQLGKLRKIGFGLVSFWPSQTH